jgi:hypothetical protein
VKLSDFEITSANTLIASRSRSPAGSQNSTEKPTGSSNGDLEVESSTTPVQDEEDQNSGSSSSHSSDFDARMAALIEVSTILPMPIDQAAHCISLMD